MNKLTSEERREMIADFLAGLVGVALLAAFLAAKHYFGWI